MPRVSMKDDDVQMWLRRIRLAQDWRRPQEDTWDRMINYLENKYLSVAPDTDKVAVNLVHPHVRVVVPAVYSRNPDILITPAQDSEYQELALKRAEVMQKVLRKLIRQMKLKEEVKRCILDAVCTGMAWMKSGYETEFYEDEKAAEAKKGLVDRLLDGMGMKFASSEDEEDDEYFSNLKINKEMPWNLRVSPYNMIVPAMSMDPNQLWYIGERIIVPFYQVKDNDEYDTRGLNPTCTANSLLKFIRGNAYSNLSGGDEEEFAILYEMYDSKTHEVFTFQEGHNKCLQRKDCEYRFLDAQFHPYTLMRFNEIPDKFFAEGDIHPAESQLLELNNQRTKMAIHTRRYNRKYQVRPGILSPEAEAALERGEDGTLIKLETTAADPQQFPFEQCIQPIQDAPLPAEVFAFEARTKSDAELILGTVDYAAIGSPRAETATQSAILESKSKLRVEERVDVVSDFVLQVIVNTAMIAQKFMTHEQIGRLVGKKNAIFWQQLDDDDEIRDELHFDIVYGSTMALNKEVDREQYLKFYMLASQDPTFDLLTLRINLVRKFDLPNPESWLNKQAIQMLEQIRMMGLQQGMVTGIMPPGMPGSQDASGSLGMAGRVPDPSKQRSAIVGNPQASSAISSNEPPVPGGRGGTARVRSPI